MNHDILGYFLGLLMGLTLGIFGGGGSILTVPIFVYVFQLNPVLATAYSLFVVGSAAFTGTLIRWRSGLIKLKIAIFFAIPSVLAVYLTRRVIIAQLPDPLLELSSFTLTKDLALMLFFALVMLIAAFSMIRGRKDRKEEKKKVNWPLVILDGLVVGVITGLVGAGGGFLIVPALVIMVGLSIKQAVATSLFIISVKSLIGFTGDIGAGVAMDWAFLLSFTAIAIAGMVIGIWWSKMIDASKLKKGFGYFVLIMAVFIILLEIT